MKYFFSLYSLLLIASCGKNVGPGVANDPIAKEQPVAMTQSLDSDGDKFPDELEEKQGLDPFMAQVPQVRMNLKEQTFPNRTIFFDLEKENIVWGKPSAQIKGTFKFIARADLLRERDLLKDFEFQFSSTPKKLPIQSFRLRLKYPEDSYSFFEKKVNLIPIDKSDEESLANYAVYARAVELKKDLEDIEILIDQVKFVHPHTGELIDLVEYIYQVERKSYQLEIVSHQGREKVWLSKKSNRSLKEELLRLNFSEDFQVIDPKIQIEETPNRSWENIRVIENGLTPQYPPKRQIRKQIAVHQKNWSLLSRNFHLKTNESFHLEIEAAERKGTIVEQIVEKVSWQHLGINRICSFQVNQVKEIQEQKPDLTNYLDSFEFELDGQSMDYQDLKNSGQFKFQVLSKNKLRIIKEPKAKLTDFNIFQKTDYGEKPTGLIQLISGEPFKVKCEGPFETLTQGRPPYTDPSYHVWQNKFKRGKAVENVKIKYNILTVHDKGTPENGTQPPIAIPTTND